MYYISMNLFRRFGLSWEYYREDGELEIYVQLGPVGIYISNGSLIAQIIDREEAINILSTPHQKRSLENFHSGKIEYKQMIEEVTAVRDKYYHGVDRISIADA